MITLTSKEKVRLRNAAQRLKPAIHIGRSGVSESVVAEIRSMFERADLLKIAFNAKREELDVLVSEIEKASDSVCVGGVGFKRSFYSVTETEEDDPLA